MKHAVFGINPLFEKPSPGTKAAVTADTCKTLPERPLTPVSNVGHVPLQSPFSPWPKNSASTGSTGSTASKNNVSRVCKVPGCLRSPCNLLSHHLYERPAERSAERQSLKRKRQGSNVEAQHHEIIPLNSDQTDTQISREGVDGLPYLPIPDRLDPEFRGLFHHFFSSVFDRLTLIFRPPPVPPIFKQRMLSLALTNRAYCMALIAHSRIDMSISQCNFSENRQSLTLYGKLIESYRKQLVGISGLQIDLMLLVLTILITYDIIHGRYQSAEIHWGGMRQLVDSRGGIHNLGVSLAYVIHLDRMCANFLQKSPMYPLPADRSIQLARPPSIKYGSKFAQYRTSHPSPVRLQTLDYCEDSCRILEVFEASHKTFNTRDAQPRPNATVEYLYYSRDRLDGQFALMQYNFNSTPPIDVIVLLATRTGEYFITWANYVPTYTILCCDRLLEHLDPSSWPPQHTDLLIWALFIPLMIAPRFWTGRAKVLSFLYNELRKKYISDETAHSTLPRDTSPPINNSSATTPPADESEPHLPDLWKWSEWQAARAFVWSDVHFISPYNDVCEDIDNLETDNRDNLEEEYSSLGSKRKSQ